MNSDKREAVAFELYMVVQDIENILGDAFDFNNFYFAGGCVYCLWNGKPVKDYDVFCKSRKAIRKLKKFFKERPELVTCKTKNAITMGKVQFVIKHIGQPEKEVAKFDFKHNLIYYDSTGVHALTDWSDIESNKLVANTDRMRDILNIVTRIPKFLGRGMEITQEEIVDILEAGTRPSRYIPERYSILQRKHGRDRY